MTNNSTTYTYFYKKVFNQSEKKIKKYLVECVKDSRPFLYAHNNIVEKILQMKNGLKHKYGSHFTSTFRTFDNRASSYSKNAIQLIINKELKAQFETDNKISMGNYSYPFLVSVLGQLEALEDAVNKFRNNSSLYEKMYLLENFKHFKLIDLNNSELHIALDKAYSIDLYGEPRKEPLMIYEAFNEPNYSIPDSIMSEDNLNDTSDTKFINLEAASAFLDKAKQTIYGLVNRKEIPHYKMSGKLYFVKQELIDWVTADSKGRVINKTKSSAKVKKSNIETGENLDSFLLQRKPKNKS